MRQLFLDKGNLVVKEVAQPLLHDNSVLVAVHYVYVSSLTDISQLKDQEGFLSNVPHKVKRVLEAVASHAVAPHIKSIGRSHAAIGYSSAGHVISVGKKVKKFAPGDYVACVDPGYSPYTDLICVPEHNVVKIANKKNIKKATVTTLAASGLQAIRRAQTQIGEWVCIFGLDVVGLLMVQLARLSGCMVIAIDDQSARLELARQYGAHAIYKESNDNLIKEIDLLTERHGVDVSFITVVTDYFFSQATTVTRRRGKVVLLHPEQKLLSYTADKDIDILLSHDISGTHSSSDLSYADMRWTDNRNMVTCLELIEAGHLNVDALVQEETNTKLAMQAYEKIQKHLAVGCVLTHNQLNNQEIMRGAACHTAPIRTGAARKTGFIPLSSECLSIGVIGAGSYAQSTLLPLLSKQKNVSIAAILDANVNRARQLAQQYNTKSYTKHDDFFKNDALDVIVIASCDILHAEQALQALQHGKAVLVEKPMVTDFSQLQRICSFVHKHKEAPFAVSYSVAHSPFAQKIKKALHQRRTPLMATYRINRDHSQHDNRMRTGGAGSIISDMCHIVDLYYYLTEAHPVSVSVEAMHSSRDDIFPTDNVSTQIGFSDGSVCSIMYTVLGNQDMGSDRLELFFDGKSVVMEDYMELYGFGLSSWFNETLTKPDYGHEAFVKEFLDSLLHEEYTPLMDAERLHTVAELTLLIDKLACEGGGKKELG